MMEYQLLRMRYNPRANSLIIFVYFPILKETPRFLLSCAIFSLLWYPRRYTRVTDSMCFIMSIFIRVVNAKPRTNRELKSFTYKKCRLKQTPLSKGKSNNNIITYYGYILVKYIFLNLSPGSLIYLKVNSNRKIILLLSTTHLR